MIPSDNYEKTFKVKSHYEKYKVLLAGASGKIQLDFREPDEIAFDRAGKQVVDMCTAMFAVWDGQEAKGLGGTGDIVKYALESNKKVVQFNPVDRVVVEI